MRVVRTAKSMTEEHRIKRRRLGQARPETIDDDKEEFVARCKKPRTMAGEKNNNNVSQQKGKVQRFTQNCK